MLNKKKCRNKVILVLKIFVFAILISAYFVITEQMQDLIFLKIEEIIHDLNVIFFRDGCMENVIGFQREGFFRNSSMVLTLNQEEAVPHYLDICYGIERDYIEMRKNIPDAFKEIE